MKRNKHNRKDFYNITSKHGWVKEEEILGEENDVKAVLNPLEPNGDVEIGREEE